MILIGMFDSPFVRRVGISLRLLGLPFEHRNWSVGKDFDRIREYNPLGRVPTLMLDDGEILFESFAILDYLDELAGPSRALLPAAGAQRRLALKRIVTATGAAEKAVLQIYERVFRPEARRHAPWVARCAEQVRGALIELDAACAASGGEFLVGDRLTQADITATCVFTFVSEVLAESLAPNDYAALRAHAGRFEALPAFQEIRAAFHPPA